MERREQNKTTIEQLAAVVQPRRSESPLFIGFTSEGLPMATQDERYLGERAVKSVESNLQSGVEFPTIDYSSVIPVVHKSTDIPVDFPNSTSKRIQDLLRYTIVTPQGNQDQITVPEISILRAIAQANQPWNEVTESETDRIVSSPKPMYTLFIEQGSQNREALAMLFKPGLLERANEQKFKLFVKDTLSKLIVIEESQTDPRERKGYIEAAAQHFGGDKKGFGNALLGLFFDTDASGGGFKAKLLKTLDSIGMLDVSDETLEKLQNPLPYYDLDGLDINDLIGVAGAMHESARTHLSPQAPQPRRRYS